MRLNLKRMIVALAAVALFGTGSVFASPPAPSPGAAAIVCLNEYKGRHFVPEYRDHLTTIADSSEAMKQTVHKYLDYEKAQQKVQQLQNELELAND